MKLWKSFKESSIGKMIWEYVLTYSNKKSFLSQKRINTAIAFYSIIVICFVFVRYQVRHDGLDYAELLSVTGILGTYATINTRMIEKNKKQEENGNESTTDQEVR